MSTTDVTIGATSTSVMTSAESRVLGSPIYVKNESDAVMALVVAGSDPYDLDPGEPFQIIPGQAVTASAVGGGKLMQIIVGVKPADESAAAAASSPANLRGTVVVVSDTGAAAIAATTASTKQFKLVCVTCHLSAGPTTSEAFTVNLDALDGAAYDTVLKSQDLSLVAATDFVYIPDGDTIYEAGDQITVAYANTDTGTYGLRIVIEEF
jgi:hypothetical protein